MIFYSKWVKLKIFVRGYCSAYHCNICGWLTCHIKNCLIKTAFLGSSTEAFHPARDLLTVKLPKYAVLKVKGKLHYVTVLSVRLNSYWN